MADRQVGRQAGRRQTYEHHALVLVARTPSIPNAGGCTYHEYQHVSETNEGGRGSSRVPPSQNMVIDSQRPTA